MDDNRKVLITCHVTIENNIPPDPKDAKKDDWKERVVVILRAVRASTMGSKARQAAEEAGGRE